MLGVEGRPLLTLNSASYQTQGPVRGAQDLETPRAGTKPRELPGGGPIQLSLIGGRGGVPLENSYQDRVQERTSQDGIRAQAHPDHCAWRLYRRVA